MKPVTRALRLFVVLAILLAGIGAAYVLTTGLSARQTPGPFETTIARAVRGVAVRAHVRGVTNPVPVSADVIAEGRDHFADHCAVCHANDGSGNVEMGRGLYPKAPDMRLPATQNLSDAELFYIIENGVRFTGMPAWSTGTKDGETASWHLVHFIRHLPSLTAEEIEHMESLNPRSPEEIRQEIDAERFLQGADVAPSPSTNDEHTGAHR